MGRGGQKPAADTSVSAGTHWKPIVKKKELGQLLKPYLQCDHVHSREAPLPLTRDEIGTPRTDGDGFPYAEGWRLRYPAATGRWPKHCLRVTLRLA